MKKSVIILVSILVVVVLIVLVYFLIVGIEGPEAPEGALDIPQLDEILSKAISSDNVEECQKLNGFEITKCISEYYFDKFKQTGDVSYCENILINDLKSECIQWDNLKLNEALENEDVSVCEEIIDETLKSECVDSFTSSQPESGGFY